METLQPKHVCPYLPYKVMAYHKEQESKIDQIVGIYYNTLDFENWSPINSNIKNYKLVLRPLTDLTKEIEVNGEKFVPIRKLFELLNEGYELSNDPECDWCKDVKKGQYLDVVWIDSMDESHQFLYNPDYYCFNHRIYDSVDDSGTRRFMEELNQTNQLQLFLKLFEWYFDVFGLIEKGLAIDINTL